MSIGDPAADDFASIVRRTRREKIVRPQDRLDPIDLDRGDIEKIVPHRGTALLLDRITGVSLHSRILVADRMLDPQDRGFDGHFPHAAVYPGVLQVEIIGQAALCLAHLIRRSEPQQHADGQSQDVRLMRINRADFVSEVRPGDTLNVIVNLFSQQSLTTLAVGQILVGDRIVCAAAIEAIDL